MRTCRSTLLLFLTGLMLSSACSGTIDGSDDPSDGPDTPFEPVAPHVYVAKVKNILTGLPPTNEELAAVVADPNALKGLVDVWAASPEGQGKLVKWLSLAFQQTQFQGLDNMRVTDASSRLKGLMRESIARTALALTAEGRPLIEMMTTKRFMMTSAMMEYYGYLDVRHVGDGNRVRVKPWQANGGNSWILQNTRPIPLERTLDPSSPDYMNWYTPASIGPDCPTRTYDGGTSAPGYLHLMLYGQVPPSGDCPTYRMGIPATLIYEDYTDWRMVTVRQPKEGERTTPFFDLPRLRSSTELVLDIPRVGFFTSLPFLGEWDTNRANDARVTVNQALIVAFGRSLDSETTIVPISETGLDDDHVTPGSSCYGCHSILDPMRGYFRRNLTVSYHEQLDPEQQARPATFSFEGVNETGSTLDDFGAALAKSPRFGIAWTQKLCFHAASAKCSEDDPEFLRVAKTFEDSNFDLRVLLRELMSSPLITGAARTKTFEDREVVVSVARYDQFCGAHLNRLGVDACNLGTMVRRTAANLPSDGYSRSGEAPVINSETTLFYRAATENICRAVAHSVLEPRVGVGRYSTADEKGAILDFVKTVMGIPEADPRHAESLQILEEHAAEAQQAGFSPLDALRSTFVLACTAPTAVAVGL
jgi:hypothetical protein